MEENFPRGGVQKKGRIQDKKRKRVEKELFQDISEKSDKKQVVKSKKEKQSFKKPVHALHPKPVVLFTNKQKVSKLSKKKKDEQKKSFAKEIKVAKQAGQQTEHKAEQLSLKHVCQSMLVLGYVREVMEYSVEMALPNGVRGEVPITNISDAYLKCLQESVKSAEKDDDQTDSQDVHSLAEIFKKGTLFPCKVMSRNKQSGDVQLSMNPRLINENMSLKSLMDSMVFYGSVESVEDHCYIIDTGVDDKRGMIKKKDAASFIETSNDGNPLKVGQVLRCRVKENEFSKKPLTEMKYLPLTVDPNELNKVKKCKDLIPGVKVNVKITEVGETGVSVSMMKQKGVIHLSHLPQKPTSYSIGAQIVCSVLYVMPENKTVMLTALPNIVNYSGEPVHLLGFGSLFIGHVIWDAKVSHVKPSKGIFVKLEGNVSGLADMDNVEEDVDYDKGSSHRCIVTNIDYEENKAQISFKKDLIKELMVGPNDLVGQTVQCEVVKVHKKKHIDAKIMGKFTALLTRNRTDDTVEYTTGMTLECKVLEVDKRGIVILSNKPGYEEINTKNTDDIQIGQAVEGCVTKIKKKEKSFEVQISGGLKGLITDKSTYDSSRVATGDTVVCRVLIKRERGPMIIALEENYEELEVSEKTLRSILRFKAQDLKSIKTDTSTWIHFVNNKCMMSGSKKDRDDAKERLNRLFKQLQPGMKDKVSDKNITKDDVPQEQQLKAGQKRSREEEENNDGSPKAKKAKELLTEFMTIKSKYKDIVKRCRGRYQIDLRKVKGAKKVMVTITGKKSSIEKAKKLIQDSIASAASKDSKDANSGKADKPSAKTEEMEDSDSEEKDTSDTSTEFMTIKSKDKKKVMRCRGRCQIHLHEVKGINKVMVTITGKKSSIEKTKKLIKDSISSAASKDLKDSNSGKADKPSEDMKDSNSGKNSKFTETMTIQSKYATKVIGSRASMLQHIRRESEAKIDLNKTENSDKTAITITGDKSSIEKAKKLIQDCIKPDSSAETEEMEDSESEEMEDTSLAQTEEMEDSESEEEDSLMAKAEEMEDSESEEEDTSLVKTEEMEDSESEEEDTSMAKAEEMEDSESEEEDTSLVKTEEMEDSELEEEDTSLAQTEKMKDSESEEEYTSSEEEKDPNSGET